MQKIIASLPKIDQGVLKGYYGSYLFISGVIKGLSHVRVDLM